MKKVALIILDGWGLGDKSDADAITMANTPFIDSCYQNYPWSHLKTFGENVGLPDGQMGNSEVGHLNIGAGRVVYQDLVKINKAIADGSIADNPVLKKTIQYCKENSKPLHLMGLVSDGGIHSHDTHLHYLVKHATEEGVEQIFIHAFTDGRDCSPTSGRKHIERLLEKIQGTNGKLVSVIGRYYAMDRDKRWERIKKAYDLLLKGEGEPTKDFIASVDAAYAKDETDEFLLPKCLVDDEGNPVGRVHEDDAVICFNFRTDRCREITHVLTQEDMPEHGMKTIPLHYVTMTNYDNSFKGIDVIFSKDNLKNTLGEVISNHHLTQVRIAETEKYPHVTYFFSGGREKEFEGERRLMVHSPKVATYDLQPEMSAYEVRDRIVEDIQENTPDFICLNFANPDMVGHTGVREAIIKAVETVDGCAKDVVMAALEKDYDIIIIADHGNADMIVNPDGSPHTAHTKNLVPCILVSNQPHHLKDGILADVAPTILQLMKLEQPGEMTGHSLLQ